VYTVTLANFGTDTTSTVTVDLSGVVADTTAQSAVTIDIDAEVTNKVSVTGSKGSNDTVKIDGVKDYSAKGLVLSGVEKMTIDGNVIFDASTISGQTMTVASDNDGTDETVTLSGTAAADTITITGFTYAGVVDSDENPSVIIDGGALGDTITVAASTVTGDTSDIIALDVGDSATFASTAATFISTSGMDVITGLSTSDKIDLSAYTLVGADAIATGSLDTDAEQAVSDLTTTVADNSHAAIRGDYSSSAATFTESATGADMLLAYDADDASGVTDFDAVVLVGLGANTFGIAAGEVAGVIDIA
jgi:hypothetical protein